MVSNDINRILTKGDCESVLFKFNRDTKLLKYTITKYSDKVVGFLAEHYTLFITFLNEKENSVSCQTFFLKSLPHHNEKQKAYIKNMGVFKKEILMYKSLISEFLILTNQSFAPNYYFSKLDECFVIEDFSSQNYKVSTEDYLSFEKCKGALSALARFHAASLIFEEIRSTNEKLFRISEHFTEEVREGTFSFQDGHVRNMWCKSATACLQNLSNFFTQNCAVGEKVREYIFSDQGLKKYIKPSDRYRNVMCHDDLWRNNMMFNEQNECILLDFQLTRYAPPIFDVLLMLNINVQRNVLDANLKLFLNLYYSFMKNELSCKNINIENILPETDFWNSVDDYSLPALLESCLYGTNVYISEELSNKVTSSMETFEEFSFKNRSPFIIEEFENNKQFRERFSNVLKPLFELFSEMS